MNQAHSEMIGKAAKSRGTPFGTAFKKVRIDYGHSYFQVSKMLGVEKATIRDWENGLSYPKGRDIARIKGTMPRVTPYLVLIPREAKDHEVVGKDVKREPIKPVPEFIPERKPPTGFGSHLELERVTAGYSQEDLGELLEVTSQSVSAWETEKVSPVLEHYEKLLEYFPNLIRAPKPDWKNIPPPTGGKGITRNAGNTNGAGGSLRAPALTWRERMDMAINTLPEEESSVLRSTMIDITDKLDALAQLDALMAAIHKVRKAIDSETPQHQIPPKPVVEDAPQAPGPAGAASRLMTAMIRLEVITRYVAKLEIETKVANEELGQAREAVTKAHEEALQEAKLEAEGKYGFY